MSNKTILIDNIPIPAEQNFLILEDDVDLNDLLVESLELMEFEGKTHQAFTIKEAKEVLKNEKITFFISDWTLPDGQGVSLLKAIRDSIHYANTPFLMVTGHNDVESMIRCSKLGSSEYLTKPYSTRELKTKIAESWKTHSIRGQARLSEKIESLESENLKLKAEIEGLKSKKKK